MAMTLEQQRAIALAQAKAAAAGGKVGSNVVEEDPMRQGKPAPEGPPGNWFDPLNAGFTAGLEAIPFVGPSALSGIEQLKAMVHGTDAATIHAEEAANRERNPVASTIGSVAGTVLPFVAGGEIPVLSKLLGMTGSLPSRIGFGAASGAGIGFGDSMVRGNDVGTSIQHGAFGAAAGGLFPAAERGVGDLIRLMSGRSVPRAVRNVSRALTDDGVPPNEIGQRLKDLGPDAMLMDLGPNLQAQAGALASVPGPGQKIVREAVKTRARGASDRVTADVNATIGSGPDLETLKGGVIDAQSKAAKPLYDAVRDVPIEAPGIVRSIIQRQMGKDALHKAVEMAGNDGYHFPANGNVVTVGLLDYMKRALDDMGSAAGRAGKNNEARQAGNMARAITQSVDRVVPAYKQARDAFAGPARVLDAIDEGASVFTKEMSPTQLNTRLGQLSTSERDGLLQGVQADIEARMGNAVNDVPALRNLFKKGWNEAKLRILLGDNVADDLLKRIDRELTFGETSGAVSRNSETARRQASQGEVNPTSGTVGAPGKTILGLVFDAFNAARNAVSGVRQPQINAEMGRLLSSAGGGLKSSQLRKLQLGAKANGPSRIAPAAVGLTEERYRKPIEITISGGNG